MNKSESKRLIDNRKVSATEQNGWFWVSRQNFFCVEKVAGIGFEGHFVTFITREFTNGIYTSWGEGDTFWRLLKASMYHVVGISSTQ